MEKIPTENTTSNEELSAIFADAGKPYGFTNVKAEFVALKDFKVKWQRTYKWADFKVSDYVNGAPKDVIKGLAEVIFNKIMGQDADYPKSFGDYVMSDAFLAKNQPIYFKRARNLTKSAVGDSWNLKQIYDGLVADAIVDNDDKIAFSWTKETDKSKLAYSSTLFKTVIMNSKLDSATVPEVVIAFLVLKQTLDIKRNAGRFIDGALTEEESNKILLSYPRYDDAKKWLADNGYCSTRWEWY